MPKAIMIIVLVTAILSAPMAVLADNPPPKPVPFTPEQFQALQQLQVQAEHTAVLEIKASYKSQREKEHDLIRASDDFWTVAHNAGFPAVVAVLLICAAPL